MKMHFVMSLDFSKLSLTELRDVHKYSMEAIEDRMAEFRRVQVTGVDSWVKTIIQCDGKIAAIKAYRDMTGRTLMQCKEYVDAMALELDNK